MRCLKRVDTPALFTPADVFRGRVEAVRQRALDVAYHAHPERFPNGPPVVRRLPAEVAINRHQPDLLRRDRADG